MRIKPTGWTPNFQPLDRRHAVAKKFSKVLTQETKSGSANGRSVSADEATGLECISAQYRLSDLRNPAKLEAMVRSSVVELLEAELAGTAGLREEDKQFLTDWMAGDPLVRAKVIAYLQKALK